MIGDLGLLRSFLAVYRAGTVTEAARRLHLSQPAVTAHIQTLERQLGVRLFVRLPRRGVAATAEADALALRIAPHLDALSAADLLDRVGEGPPVRLGGPADLLATFVIPAVAPLLGCGLRLHARTSDQADVIDDVAGGGLDIVVTVGAVVHRGVSVVPLFDKQVVLVGAPRWAEHLTSDTVDKLGPDALRGVPVLAYNRDLRVIDIYFNALFGRPPAIQPALVIDDLRAVTAAARAGAGVTVVPWYYVRDDLRSGALVELHRPHRRPTEPVIAVTHPAAADARIDAIIDALHAAEPARDAPPATRRQG
ncbi:MAG: LysR family transcriptional regulator [Trebonia sp.]